MQVCRELAIPVHIKWRGCKIESFTPEKAKYEATSLYIWGDHLYTVGDASIEKAMAKNLSADYPSSDWKRSKLYTNQSILGEIHEIATRRFSANKSTSTERRFLSTGETQRYRCDQIDELQRHDNSQLAAREPHLAQV